MSFNEAEDTFLKVKKSLNCKGTLLDLSTPAIMGILNITPDSFYDGGLLKNDNSIITKAESLLIEGATILDIGGQSSRPGAKPISVEEEWNRIFPALKVIVKEFPDAILSVDTYFAEIAKRSVEEGASIINDISAGNLDPDMFAFIVHSKVPYIMMHMKGTPLNMQIDPSYVNLHEEIITFFTEKISALTTEGVTDIVIDPGFGFGKSVAHNYQLLKHLSLFKMFGFPMLVGLSRKSMVTKVLKTDPSSSLNGTSVLNTIALLKGASILRVHDVKEAVEVKILIDQYLLVD